MLVLSRKEGERVMIGDDMTVTVLEIRGDRIKLGFDCPLDIPVHREEVRRRLLDSPPIEPRSAGFDESPYYAEFA